MHGVGSIAMKRCLELGVLLRKDAWSWEYCYEKMHGVGSIAMKRCMELGVLL